MEYIFTKAIPFYKKKHFICGLKGLRKSAIHIKAKKILKNLHGPTCIHDSLSFRKWAQCIHAFTVHTLIT